MKIFVLWVGANTANISCPGSPLKFKALPILGEWDYTEISMTYPCFLVGKQCQTNLGVWEWRQRSITSRKVHGQVDRTFSFASSDTGADHRWLIDPGVTFKENVPIWCRQPKKIIWGWLRGLGQCQSMSLEKFTMNHAMDELVRLSSDSCAAGACFLCQRHQFSKFDGLV